MSPTQQSVIDDSTAHPTDPYWGRMHRHASGRTAQIRRLTSDDVESPYLSGRPGVDYRVQHGYHGAEDASVITPQEYANWQSLPRNDMELGAVRLYDWLAGQGVPMISSTDLVTDPLASGVAVQIIWGIDPPRSAMVHLLLRSDNAKLIAGDLEGLLERLGINVVHRLEPGGPSLQFSASVLGRVPG